MGKEGKRIKMESRRTPFESNFKKQDRDLVKNITRGEQIFDHLKEKPGAILALREMRSLGIDVKIIYSNLDEKSYQNLHRLYQWITKELGSEYIERIICFKDKTILKSHYLIDDNIAPEKSGKIHPEWEHILFDQPYNRTNQIVKKRLDQWINWRNVLSLTKDIDLLLSKSTYFDHGSIDSMDIDRFYVMETMPSTEECYHLCKGTGEDRNIITVKDGVISDCFKGTADQCNNGLFMTYSLHNQKFENPIKKMVTRLVPLKVVEAVRKILSRSGRHSTPLVREQISNSLKSRIFQERIDALHAVNYCQNAGMSVESKKVVAFQLGQTIALINGQQIFTKQVMYQSFPELEPILKRKELPDTETGPVLNKYRDIFLTQISGVSFDQSGDLILFQVEDKKKNLKLEFL
eukprot:TRINITY_DN2064_c0_g2_i1.p1 TRINITY_DN2064_c0_g2~~TRINITY_DN2064_c0_g2_i1.p1  ORF type:complete len:406 (+),score=99.56 TRINITY_DN2064_c0_g2_i1:90-1307(+)